MPDLRWRLRRVRWWIVGYWRCYAQHESGTAFCKRRAHHFGAHRTANRAVTWGRDNA